VSEVLSQKFPPFDHQSVIIGPFEDESKRDVDMLIELMLEFHAWSTARPVYASETTAEALEKEIHDIIETENEQGRSTVSLPPPQTIVDKTRQRLIEFVERIKIALAALTRF
ncbi:uncharacterized protein PHACADRAFT_89911, partial [Phanerochaete carnosa HHB-10118-sp]